MPLVGLASKLLVQIQTANQDLQCFANCSPQSAIAFIPKLVQLLNGINLPLLMLPIKEEEVELPSNKSFIMLKSSNMINSNSITTEVTEQTKRDTTTQPHLLSISKQLTESQSHSSWDYMMTWPTQQMQLTTTRSSKPLLNIINILTWIITLSKPELA